MAHVDHYRNGKKLVSATELTNVISKPFLDKWRTKLCHCLTHAEAKKTPLKPAEVKALAKFGRGHCGMVYADQVKDDAGELGTQVHEVVEAWFKKEPVPAHPEEVIKWADKITSLYTEHDVKPHLIIPESSLVDDESNLAGSPDTVATWDGRPEILDTKIKNQLDDFTPMQGCAYRYLLKRKQGVDIKWMRAIWCQKESKNKDVKDVLFDLDDWTEDWKALVRIWNRANPSRKVIVHG